ncbi:MAG TPA: LysR family transcriptional regulator [Ramlibacter sp.]|nr:LysR family transcriptional regulator [Ramlibacter sp.]
MELKQLRLFVVLSQETHFRRAAERLFISQPALSASLVRLEEEFGFRLFDRDTRSVRITPAGELMLRYTREILNHVDRTQGLSRALAEGRIGRVEIGFSGLLFNPGLDAVILGCRADFPELEIYMREVTSQKQVELLEAGRLDAGLLSLAQAPMGVERIALMKDQFVACLPAGHRLAQRKSIEVGELRDDRFVFTSRDRAPATYDQLMGFCAQAGFQPRVAVEADSSLSTAKLIARGFGAGFLPASLAGADVSQVVFVPLRGQAPSRQWYFIWKAERQTPGLEVVIDRIREFAAA